MPEGRSKVICYSDLMPRYIMAAASAFLLLCAFSLQALAAEQQNAPSSYTAQSQLNDPVHQLITSHVRAIKTRDAAQAYHLISMNGQEKYGTAKLYWRDVRQNMRLLFNRFGSRITDSHNSVSRHLRPFFRCMAPIMGRFNAQITYRCI